MKVQDLLPHREPFVFIDEIIEVKPGESSITSRVVKDDEFWVKGHFPGNPIFPGALLLETMAQGGGILLNAKEGHSTIEYNAYITKVVNLKFIRPVHIGDKIIVQGSFVDRFGDFRTVKTKAFVDDKKVAEAVITYVITQRL